MEGTGIAKNWKPSQFNEYLGYLDNKWVVYNNLSGAMIGITRPIYDALSENKINELSDQNICKGLQYGKFIITDNIDEVEEFRKVKNELAVSARVIGIQILPTLRCNFKCVYCYEQAQDSSQIMPEEVMGEIIKYVRKKIMPTTEYLNVLWYGGEPLLAIDRIEYLSEALINLSKEKNINYDASMVTNGYLLNKRNIDILLKNKVESCQVTIDGPEKVHNSRRMLRNGGKTWKRIIDNIKYAVSKKLAVSIRINTDKSNIDSLGEFFSELKYHDVYDKVTYSIGVVSHFGNVCRSIEDTFLTVEKVDEFLDQKDIKHLLDNSRNSLIRPIPDFIGCVATAKNSLIIGPGGELYKCSKTIGDINELFGHISNPDLNHQNFKKWENISNLNSKNCKKCSMVPVCNGKGCAFEVLIKQKDICCCNSDEFQKIHKAYRDKLKTLYQRRQSGLKNKLKN